MCRPSKNDCLQTRRVIIQRVTCVCVCVIRRIDDRLGSGRRRFRRVRAARSASRPVSDRRDVAPRRAGRSARRRDGRTGQP